MGRRTVSLVALVAGAGLAAAALAIVTIQKPPSAALADRIDHLLESDPCVGQVESWPSRDYSWGQTDFTHAPGVWRWFGSDTSTVDIRFYRGQPNPETYPPGRQLQTARQILTYDDSDSWFVFATYDVAENRLNELRCGPNYPEDEPAA